MPARDPQPLDELELSVVGHVLESFWKPLPSDFVVLYVLTGGYLNRGYVVNLQGKRFVLRRYDYNLEREVIEYEHRLLQSLPIQLHRAVVQKPITTLSKETLVYIADRYYALFPYIDGEPFDRSNNSLFQEAGQTLAAYHNAVNRYDPKPQKRPHYSTVSCLDWVARHTSGLSELWEDVAKLPIRNLRDQHVNEGLDFLAEEATILNSLLDDKTYKDLPQLVIHNDFGPNNLLCKGNQIVGLLDFDLVTWDARAYDLATALMWFGDDPTLIPSYGILPGDKVWSMNTKRAQKVFHAYAANVNFDLSDNEIRLLPVFMRSYGLWFAIWYLDRRIAGLDWYPEEISGLIPFLQWFRKYANECVASIVA